MTRRSRILTTLLLVVVAAVGALGIALSHNSACGTAPPLAGGVPTMKAAVYRCYGSPDVVRIETVAKPVPRDHQLLIRVHAASLNALDWHLMRGEPYLIRPAMTGMGAPQDVSLGADFAGTVESVGKLVTRFKPGDEVFGGASGTLAEYIVVGEGAALAIKPANLSFDQAAAVPVAALTALHALRRANLQPGQTVLVNGAAGGVGTFAVQIARAMGAEVTAVTSTANLDLVRSLGAHEAIDYTRQDFTRDAHRYDVIIDCGGGHSLTAVRRALAPTGIYVSVGEAGMGKWIEPFLGFVTQPVVGLFGKQHYTGLLVNNLDAEGLASMRELLASGPVRPVIDRRYPLEQTATGLRYLETGKVRGKLIVSLN